MPSKGVKQSDIASLKYVATNSPITTIVTATRAALRYGIVRSTCCGGGPPMEEPMPPTGST
eukprot:CAMPEP_0181415098 /NCGR_PEP_ID=MMETSP1110-20121109/9841_1 /TAXON_ID=174948 /ORGANISM="Symbiodinium sp., Strain CCMP421" /LENGTH=60 /DNA_ID=CAMNT_0023537989 /DNA_START=401 /DNA_END=579 /DNA_ORIENTATION=+